MTSNQFSFDPTPGQADNSSNSQSPLERLYGQLDEEEAQEQQERREAHSLLLGVNPERFREREREYIDVEKHWVRRNAWLKAAQQVYKRKRELRQDCNGLRYFTLPAYYRFDVSLLLKEGLLEVTSAGLDDQANQVYVAAFETDPTKFGRMQGQNPRFKLLGSTSIEDVLTNSKNEYYHQLRDLFPFDVVNLDLTTSLTPKHEGPYSKTMQAIEAVFELQAGVGTPWAMFLTFRNMPDEWEEEALRQLLVNLQDNLKDHPVLLEIFQRRYQANTVEQLKAVDPKKCISQSVAKWITERAHHHKFTLNHLGCYSYPRLNEGLSKYFIYKLVFIFERADINVANIPTKGLPPQAWMERDLVKCIETHTPVDVEDRLLAISYGS